jgi:hypothetical protein
MSLPSRLAALALLALVAAPTASAQLPQTRSGFWFNFGLGYGSLDCENCTERTGASSGQLSLGGTLSDKWLLGAGWNGWIKSENGATLTVGTLTAMARFYPSATGGFYLQGGLGFGVVNLELEFGGTGNGNLTYTAEESGAGAVLGIGYDFRVGRNISISPFANAYGVSFDGGNASVGQIGVGLTVH